MFFYVKVGKTFKQLYNLNCQSNVLLDAIRMDALGYVTAAIGDRLDDILAEREIIATRKEEIAFEKKNRGG